MRLKFIGRKADLIPSSVQLIIFIYYRGITRKKNRKLLLEQAIIWQEWYEAVPVGLWTKKVIPVLDIKGVPELSSVTLSKKSADTDVLRASCTK